MTSKLWRKIQQEVYDSHGNLTWKRSVYKIPKLGDYKAYDVVVNLVHKASGNDKIFKYNFVKYVEDVEGERKTYDVNEYINKAIEILKEELNYDKHNVAMAMNYITENNLKALERFKDRFNDEYARYLKK